MINRKRPSVRPMKVKRLERLGTEHLAELLDGHKIILVPTDASDKDSSGPNAGGGTQVAMTPDFSDDPYNSVC